MSSVLANAALSIAPAVQGKNLYVLDLTVASQNILVPDAWCGKYLTITPRGGTAYFAFKYGASGPTVDETAVATIASDTVTPVTNGADHVGSGGTRFVDLRNVRPFRVDPSNANSVQPAALQLRFGWKGSVAGQLVVVVSDGPVNP